MMASARTVARSFENALGTTDVNIYMNNGSHSGQMVFHAHIHIIPRYEGDGHKAWHGRKNYSEGEAQTIADKIKKAL